MKPLLEKEIQSAILEYLRYRKIFAWKQNTAGIMKANGSYIPAGMRGVSDIIGILPKGRFLAVEVKRKGKQPTEEQKLFLARISANGGLAFVAWSLDDVIKRIP